MVAAIVRAPRAETRIASARLFPGNPWRVGRDGERG